MSTPQGPFDRPQQSPGQPPQPGQPGQPFPGQQPGEPTGASTKPKRSTLGTIKLVVSVVILIIVVVVGVSTWYSGQQRDKALTVGQCVHIKGDQNEAEVESVDCDADGSEQVVLRVIEKHDGAATCSDDMLAYEETSKRRRSGKERVNKTVCLAEVLAEGKMYKADKSVAPGLREVKSADEADFKVTKVHESADGSCAAEEHAASYPKWPRTYCLGEP